MKRNTAGKGVLMAAQSASRSVLPRIPYNQEELQEIVDMLLQKLPPAKKTDLSAYLSNIAQRVAEINEYQDMSNPAGFTQEMNTALLQIRNTVNAIYELTKHCHDSLPNTVKRRILEWIKPLEEELARLGTPPSIRDALELKTKHLYAEQSFISRQPHLQRLLMQCLDQLKSLLTKPGQPAPRCYLSYAWPSEKNKEQEYWVQPFLYVLYDHLKAAGIRVVMDIRDNNPGDSIFRFMDQYHHGNYVILVGTESLLEKHRAEGAHAVHTELSIIANRFEQDQKQFGQSRIYPMLMSGTIKTAYPEIYDKYHTVRDARPDYLGTLKKLTDWIYESRLDSVRERYDTLWRQCCEEIPALSTDSTAIEQEIAMNYHKPRFIEYLRQDIPVSSSGEVAAPVIMSVSRSTTVLTQPTITSPMVPGACETAEGPDRLLPSTTSNTQSNKKTFCPYFSRAAFIGCSVIVGGIVLETARRYYSKP